MSPDKESSSVSMRAFLFVIFLVVFHTGICQTMVSIPSKRIDFDDLPSLTQSHKEIKKEAQKLSREKRAKQKQISKKIKKYTHLKKDSIRQLKKALSVFDIEDLEEIDIEIDELEKAQKYHDQARDYQAQWQSEREQLEAYHQQAKEKLKRPVLEGLPVDSMYADSITHINYDSLSLSALGVDSLNQYIDYREQLPSKDSLMALSVKALEPVNDELERAKYFKDSLQVELEHEVDRYMAEYMDSTLLAYATPDSLKSMFKVLDSLESESFQQKVSRYLEEKTREKLNEKFDLASYIPPDQGPVTTAQFIPSIEEFNYKKPTIPDMKLKEAILEKELQERKQKALGVLNKKDTTLSEAARKKPEKRWQMGGYIQYLPSPQSIEVAPTVGYFFRERWLIGGGYTRFFMFDREQPDNVGYRVFLQPYFGKGYFLHAESVWQKNQPDEGTQQELRSTSLGIGKSIRYKSFKSDIIMLYNFDAPNTFQAQKITFKFGFSFLK